MMNAGDGEERREGGREAKALYARVASILEKLLACYAGEPGEGGKEQEEGRREEGSA
jgi:hypothetical protein